MKGFVNVLKAPGVTSSTVVSLMRHILDMKKIGHTGTLDPSACGVLPMMVGKATKLLDYLDEDDKEYISEFVFGVDTDTLDMQGNILNSNDKIIELNEIYSILQKFIGDIKQYPPKVSAILINGQKAYSLQRQGLTFDVPQREVCIKNIEIIRQTGINRFLLKINCSRGTYIRSICRDMASELGTYAYISYLNRTKSGVFHIDQAFTVEQLRELNINDIILPLDYPLKHMKRINIEQKYLKNLVNGLSVEYNDKIDGVFRIYSNDIFLGLGKQNNETNQIVLFKRLLDEEEL